MSAASAARAQKIGEDWLYRYAENYVKKLGIGVCAQGAECLEDLVCIWCSSSTLSLQLGRAAETSRLPLDILEELSSGVGVQVQTTRGLSVPRAEYGSYYDMDQPDTR